MPVTKAKPTTPSAPKSSAPAPGSPQARASANVATSVSAGKGLPAGVKPPASPTTASLHRVPGNRHRGGKQSIKRPQRALRHHEKAIRGK